MSLTLVPYVIAPAARRYLDLSVWIRHVHDLSQSVLKRQPVHRHLCGQ